MWGNFMKIKFKKLLLQIVFFLSIFSYASLGFAAETAVSIGSMIENIAATIPDLMQLTTAIAYILGFYMVIMGVIGLKKFGEARTMMSSEASVKGPIVELLVGAALIYLPSSVSSGMTTFWTNPAPYAYMTTETDPWHQFYQACFLIIQLVGTIAFIRGLIIMSNAAHGHGRGEAGFGRGVAHMVGGIFCIDMYDFLHAVFTTLGISWSFGT